MALTMAPSSPETLAVAGDIRRKLSTEEVCPFDEQQIASNAIKSKNNHKDKTNNTGNATKRKPSSTKRRTKKLSSKASLKDNVDSETKYTSDDVTTFSKQKDKKNNGSSASAKINNRSIENLNNSKIMDITNSDNQATDQKPNGLSAMSNTGSFENNKSKIVEIIVSGNEGSIHRSSHSRILPQRPAFEVARDKKRILEICFGSEKETPPRPPLKKNTSPAKTLPTDDETDDPSMHKERRKRKKDSKKLRRKKKTVKKEEKIDNNESKESTATNDGNDPKCETDPLHRLHDMTGGSPKKGESQLRDKPNATAPDDTPMRIGKPPALKRIASPSNAKKRRRRRPVVRRDAAGKIIRRRKKGKGRDRVVRKDCFRKGKDAKIGLATIDEGFYDDLSEDSSDYDSLSKSYQSSNISGADIDSNGDENLLASSDRISTSSDSSDDKGGKDNSDLDRGSYDSNINDKSESVRRVDQRLSGSVDTSEGDDIKGRRPVSNLQRSNNESIEVSLSNRVSSTTTQQIGSVVDPIERISNNIERTTPNNQEFSNESGDVVDMVPDSDITNINNGDRDPSLRSISSEESTACTSTAEVENARDRKSFFCFGSTQNMICASFSFVVLVAAATVMVVYLITFRNNYDFKPTVSPTSSPVNMPTSDKRSSLRPSRQPVSTAEPSNNAPTLAPTTIFDTLSTSCKMPDDNPDIAVAELEYATELFGLASISNANTGYCGEGYVTNLTRSGSGFGFRSVSVKTTGYYKLAIRYSHTDQTQQSLYLQINDRNVGTLDLVSTGNETLWLIDGVDDIVLREGEYTIAIWVEYDGVIGPSVDWMALNLQESKTTLEYLSVTIAQSSGLEGQLTLTQTRTLEWMSNEDLIDWLSLTDREIIERYALIQIYNAAKGDAWMNNNQWLSEFHACSWYGITCSKDMFVTDLMLDNNGLIGYLPSDISLLTNLILISLDSNDLQGMIPTEIGKLTNLSKLFLHANFLTGFLPSELGLLEGLETFDMRANFLFGSIPEQLYSMVRLESLALGSNILSGTLSKSIEQLETLKNLDIQVNNLSGTIPSELGELTLLSSLALGYNWFTGTIPGELGLLKNLTVLDINSNRLTGMLPPELSLLNNTIIDYYGNDIIV